MNKHMNTSLYYFMIIAEEQSIAKAARRLYVSPQNLSNYIHRLEEEYGTLFIRKPQFKLTPAGTLLLNTLQQISILEKGLHAQLNHLNSNESTYIRFGIHSTRARAIMPYILPELRARVPNLFLDLRHATVKELEKQLAIGEIDAFLGVDTTPNAAFALTRLHREPIYLVVSKKLLEKLNLTEAIPSEPQQKFPLACLERLPYLLSPPNSRFRKKLELFCKGSGLILHEVVRISDFELQIQLAAQEQGACFCPQMMLERVAAINRTHPDEPMLYAMRVESLEFTSNISLVTHKLAAQTPELTALIEVFQQEFLDKFYLDIGPDYI